MSPVPLDLDADELVLPPRPGPARVHLRQAPGARRRACFAVIDTLTLAHGLAGAGFDLGTVACGPAVGPVRR